MGGARLGRDERKDAAGPTVTSKSKATFGGGRMDDLTTGASVTGRVNRATPKVTAAIVAATATSHGIVAQRPRVAMALASAATPLVDPDVASVRFSRANARSLAD